LGQKRFDLTPFVRGRCGLDAQTQVRSLAGLVLCFTATTRWRQGGRETQRLARKARLALALMLSLLLQSCWCLDERPTNHLDIPAKQYCSKRPCVSTKGRPCWSHDRSFILAGGPTGIVEIRDGRAGALPRRLRYSRPRKDTKRRNWILGGPPPPRCREAKKSATARSRKPAPPEQVKG